MRNAVVPVSDASDDTTIDMEWSGATGNATGLGYSYLFDTSPSTVPDAVTEQSHSSDPHTATSDPLADGLDRLVLCHDGIVGVDIDKEVICLL